MKKAGFLKVMCMVLVLCTIITLLVGCGQGTGDTKQNGSTQASSSNSGDTAKKTIKIGLSLATLENERWIREKENMENYAKQLGNVEIIAQSANNDETKQLTQCENLLSQGIDILLVVPQNGDAASQIIEKAHASKVPVIAYDRMILNCDLDYYVSFDSVRVGEVMTNYVLQKVPKGNYIVLKGDPTDNNAVLVYQGIMKALQSAVDKGDVKIVSDQWCKGWDQAEAMKHTENALTAQKNNIQAIITSYDGMANGAIQALKAQGLEGKVPVTGQDAEVTACQRIVEGTQTLTVYKPLTDLSKAAIDAAIAVVRGQTPVVNGKTNNKFKDVPSILPEVFVVDKDNMVEKIVKDNFHTMDEVYKNVPKEQWPKN